MLKPLILIGSGGHAGVLVDILLRQDRKILAVVSPDEVEERFVLSGVEHLTSDEEINKFDCRQVKLVNGIGMMPRSQLRQQVNNKFLALGYEFETVVAKEAVVSPYAKIELGSQILVGAIVQAGALIGAHSIINTGAIVEHDCRIGSYNHIAPKAVLCGQVTTEDNVYVGASSVVIQGISIAHNAIVGAGSTVTKNVYDNELIFSKCEVTRKKQND